MERVAIGCTMITRRKVERTAILALAFTAFPFALSCKHDEAKVDQGSSSANGTNGTTPSAVRTPGSKLLLGSWQAEEFIAATPAGSSSAAALNAQMGSDAAQAVRVTYTLDQVKITVSGQVLASSYVVREDGLGKCTLLNGKDTVLITFLDDDHMIIDRQGNAYSAKMRMRRLVSDASPIAP